MKTLYLFRHGDTEDAGSGADYSRKLTLEGEKQSGEMADHLKDCGCIIDRIITSGAPRAMRTACIIADCFGYPTADIVTDDILYSSKNPEDIFYHILEFSSGFSSVMLVGHNPLLSDLAAYAGRLQSLINIGKSSPVRMDFDTADWSSILPRSGKIVFYKTFEKGRIVDVITCAQ